MSKRWGSRDWWGLWGVGSVVVRESEPTALEERKVQILMEIRGQGSPVVPTLRGQHNSSVPLRVWVGLRACSLCSLPIGCSQRLGACCAPQRSPGPLCVQFPQPRLGRGHRGWRAGSARRGEPAGTGGAGRPAEAIPPARLHPAVSWRLPGP